MSLNTWNHLVVNKKVQMVDAKLKVVIEGKTYVGTPYTPSFPDQPYMELTEVMDGR